MEKKKHYKKKQHKSEVTVSIILIIQNNYWQLKKLLPAVLKNSTGVKYEIIAISNKPKSKSITYLSSYLTSIPIKIITNKNKTSFSALSNQCVENANGEFIVLLSKFIPPPKDWLRNFLAYTNHDHLGIIGGRQLSYWGGLTNIFEKKSMKRVGYSNTGIVFADYTTTIHPYPLISTESEELTAAPRSVVNPICMLLSRKTYLEIGGLDITLHKNDALIDLNLRFKNKGLENIYCPTAIFISSRKPLLRKFTEIKNNITKPRIEKTSIQEKWFSNIKHSYWSEKVFNKSRLFTEAPLTIAIAVTDHGKNVTAGDYFTAQELGIAMESLGWKVSYLSRKKEEWYKLPNDVDVLLNLLDAYDLRKVPARKKRLLTVAWPRNWFDLWCHKPWFNNYDIVLSSSQSSCEFIKKYSLQSPLLMPIASSSQRFSETPSAIAPSLYKSDICFTGSYWDHPRDIIGALSKEVLNKYNVAIFGANWEKVDKLKEYSRGFINYEDIPLVYHNTKIVIDDANHVTKPYGSVNSRVFDALMSGALVITNGAEGSKALFQGELPYYENSEELTQLINFYINNDKKRISKVRSLKKIITNNHTYLHRATTFQQALVQRVLHHSIALKVPAPSWEVAHNWGDYHMALSLKTELEKLNYRVILQILPEWDNDAGAECDFVIVFRGLSRYKIKPHQVNIMWNISHPDKVSLEEYEQYDKVYIASELWSKEVSKKVSVPVESMLQCTNPEIFHEPTDSEKINYKQELLFVGNSRNVFRKIMQDLLPTPHGLSVFGQGWNNFIPEKYIKGEHISNDELYKYYGSACIVLNDHWDDMRQKGFISNRLFDALACGAFIVSDRVNEVGGLKSFIKMYDTKAELKELLDDHLSHSSEHNRQHQLGIKHILEAHTFKHRAEQFSTYIKRNIISR